MANLSFLFKYLIEASGVSADQVDEVVEQYGDELAKKVAREVVSLLEEREGHAELAEPEPQQH